MSSYLKFRLDTTPQKFVAYTGNIVPGWFNFVKIVPKSCGWQPKLTHLFQGLIPIFGSKKLAPLHTAKTTPPFELFLIKDKILLFFCYFWGPKLGGSHNLGARGGVVVGPPHVGERARGYLSLSPWSFFLVPKKTCPGWLCSGLKYQKWTLWRWGIINKEDNQDKHIICSIMVLLRLYKQKTPQHILNLTLKMHVNALHSIQLQQHTCSQQENAGGHWAAERILKLVHVLDEWDRDETHRNSCHGKNTQQFVWNHPQQVASRLWLWLLPWVPWILNIQTDQDRRCVRMFLAKTKNW